MTIVKSTSLALGLLAVCASLASASPDPVPSSLTGLTLVNLRIEGAKETIYEGIIPTKGHNVTTASGGTHHCDGTNLNANPTPGPTATGALDNAAKALGFTWDGTYDGSFDDYFITRIGGSTQTATQFWGVLLNGKFTEVGGCQQKVKKNDKILWAYDAFNKKYFLEIAGSNLAKVGAAFKVTVSDGPTGAPVPGATISFTSATDLVVSGTTETSGQATVTFTKPGVYKLKASRSDSLRSNTLTVIVSP
ncbi:hypothetical protein FRC07_004767 [Ceratobasidium sp. 392]|nr:hypothetical protein FRC07_004767 [Ceratobasidium sp. 392]